jgi:WD40 repeat protein
LLAVTAFGQDVQWIQPGGVPTAAAVGGQYLVTGNGSGLIQLWDRSGAAPKFIRTLAAHDYPIWTLNLSADGKTLVSTDGLLHRRIWSLPEGTNYSFGFTRFEVTGYQAKSNRVVTLGPDWDLRFWDVATGSSAGRIDVERVGNWFVISPNDQMFAFATSTGAAIFPLSTQEPRWLTAPDAHPANHNLAFSNDSRKLAMDVPQSAADTNLNSILIWDVATGEIEKTLRGADGLHSMIFSPDDRLLATVGDDYSVVFWDLETKAVTARVEAQWSEPVVFFRTNLMMIGNRLVNLTNGMPAGSARFTTGRGSQHSMEFNADGSLLADGKFVWETSTGNLRCALKPKPATNQPQNLRSAYITPLRRSVIPMRFSSDNSTLIVGDAVFDLGNGEQIANLPVGYTNAFPIAFSSNWYATVSLNMTNVADFRSYANGSILRRLSDSNFYMARVMGVSRSESLIATAGSQGPWDARVRIWNGADGAFLRVISNRVAVPSAVKFSGDEKFVAAGSEESGPEVRVWNVETGRELFARGPGEGAAMAFDFFPESNFLIWGHQQLQISDPAAGIDLAILTNEVARATAVAVSPNAKSIAVGRSDGSIVMVEAPTADGIGIQRSRELSLSFYARPSVSYRVEHSSDLHTWSVVTNVIGAGARMEIPVSSSQNSFYRLR